MPVPVCLVLEAVLSLPQSYPSWKEKRLLSYWWHAGVKGDAQGNNRALQALGVGQADQGEPAGLRLGALHHATVRHQGRGLPGRRDLLGEGFSDHSILLLTSHRLPLYCCLKYMYTIRICDHLHATFIPSLHQIREHHLVCGVVTLNFAFVSEENGVTPQGNGGLQAGVTMDGILARDLQLRPSSKFAYLLRPLPTRAAQLDAYAQLFRRRILRVVSLSKAAKRWVCHKIARHTHLLAQAADDSLVLCN